MTTQTRELTREVATILRELKPSEIKEACRFALSPKTRSVIDPGQSYFWTRGWQRMERAAAQDKKRGRFLGDGTLEGLLNSLHS